MNSLKKAINSLEEVIGITLKKDFSQYDLIMQKAIKAGVIQNFEFTYELCWKFMKRYLSGQLGSAVVDGVSRMELFRLSREHHLIEDIAKWKQYHEYRNLTSHIYDEEVLNEIFKASLEFLLDAKSFYANLEERND